MESSRTILKNLKNHNQYSANFPISQQSTYFEQLIAKAFGRILYLPFYASDNDDNKIPYRIVWQGMLNPIDKAPPGPDAIAYCYGFYLIIEATLKTGAKQWSQEFASSIEHCENFCSQSRIATSDVYGLMVCSELHKRTYRSIKSNPEQEYRLIPIELSKLVRILETSILAFTMRHLELRGLLNQILGCIRSSPSVEDFSESVNDTITAWQKNVLKSERSAFFGVKSYEVMRKIGRNAIGVTEILQRLQKYPIVGRYFNIIGEKPTLEEIEKDLMEQSLACPAGRTIQQDEPLFEPVPSVDFKGRNMRLIDAVMKIG